MILRAASATVLFLALCFGALVPRTAQATPSKDGCTGMLDWQPDQNYVEVPTSGVWCLDHDLVVGTDTWYFQLFYPQAADITIDCRGHRLEYVGPADYAIGIAGGAGQRLTVRNCHFKNFTHAFRLDDVNGYLIEDNVIESSFRTDEAYSVAIEAGGSGTIRRNRIYDSVNRAIDVGPESIVEDNLIDGVSDYPTGFYVVGIAFRGNGSQIRRNTVRNLRHLSTPVANTLQALSQASDAGGSGRTVIEDNVLSSTNGEADTAAISCYNPGGARIVDNIIGGFTYATFVCTAPAPGDNDVTP